jgi:O-acetyl-ADP-ribose deacetylase (regulator of RNase III)
MPIGVVSGVAAEHAITSLAFPSISTGAYRFPIDAAARTAIDTVIEVLEQPGG